MYIFHYGLKLGGSLNMFGFVSRWMLHSGYKQPITTYRLKSTGKALCCRSSLIWASFSFYMLVLVPCSSLHSTLFVCHLIRIHDLMKPRISMIPFYRTVYPSGHKWTLYLPLWQQVAPVRALARDICLSTCWLHILSWPFCTGSQPTSSCLLFALNCGKVNDCSFKDLSMMTLHFMHIVHIMLAIGPKLIRDFIL